MILAACLCERYIVTDPDFFWADQYIHQTHEGVTMIGPEQKNFKTCSFRGSKTVFPDPACC